MNGSRQREPESVEGVGRTSRNSARALPNFVLAVGVHPEPFRSKATPHKCAGDFSHS